MVSNVISCSTTMTEQIYPLSHRHAGLKTAKGTKQLKLDPSIYEAMQKERVEVGDVIYIEANSGAVKRTGRSDAFATEFDLEVSDAVF